MSAYLPPDQPPKPTEVAPYGDHAPLPLNPIEAPDHSLRRTTAEEHGFVPVIPMAKVPYIPFDYTRHKPQMGRPRATTRETQRAHYAFLVYCSLGPKRRSYQAVLNHLVTEGKLSPKSFSQVRHWGKLYNWFERAKEYDAAVVEKEREEWDATRIARLQARAAAAGEGYDEAVALVIEKLRAARGGGRNVPFEAVVQAVKILADVEYRDRNDLTDHAPETAKASGITITIGSYDNPPGAALPGNKGAATPPPAALPPAPTTTITQLPTVEGEVRSLPDQAPDPAGTDGEAEE